MESLDWPNPTHQELEEAMIIPASVEIQTPDSLSGVFPQPKSGAFTSWGSDMNPNNALVTDSGMAIPQGNSDSLQYIKSRISTSTSSVQSLDCFMSTLNETSSTEDDGIYGFFSGNKSPWNFTGTVPTVLLSGNPNHGLENPPHKHTIINQPRSSGKQSQANNSEIESQNLDFRQSNYTVTACHPDRTSFQATSQIHPIPKKPRLDNHPISLPIINFQPYSQLLPNPNMETINQMKEMVYKAAVFRPVNFTMGSMEKPRRKNVRISNDPQTVAARQRRERISERIRVLQKLVPGGSKMDTASMLDEAANYLKFLRAQAKALEDVGHRINDQAVADFPGNVNLSFPPNG